MSRVSKQLVHEALDRIGVLILEAGGPDGIVSRKDLREKLKTLDGIEKNLTERFYHFMDHRDYRPGARITQRDVEDTLAYSKEKLIDAYDLNNNGLSRGEVAQMSVLGQWAVEYALALKHGADGPTDEELVSTMGELSKGLFFFAFGSEADETMETFQQEVLMENLNMDSFSHALQLDQNDPAEFIVRYVEDTRDLHTRFQDQHLRFNPELGQRAVQLIQLMDQHLTQIRVFILGKDNWQEYPRADHPVYWIGLSKERNLIGLKTQVIWT